MLKIQSLRARKARKRVREFCQWLYDRRSYLPYQEYRPMRSFPTAWCKLPPHPTDCSEMASIILHASGAPTPYVVNGLGYTGTMLAKLPHIKRRQTRRGDLAVFVHPGRPEGDHVVVLMQGGTWHRDPEVFSHGSPGVFMAPLSQEARYHPGCKIVFLRAVPIRL